MEGLEFRGRLFVDLGGLFHTLKSAKLVGGSFNPFLLQQDNVLALRWRFASRSWAFGNSRWGGRPRTWSSFRP